MAKRTDPKVAIRNLRRFFGHFPQVKTAHGRLEALFSHECDGEEPECLAIVGDTGTGKSTLIGKFVDKHPRIAHDEFTEIPVLCVGLPAKCSIKTLAGRLLRALGSPYWNRGDEGDRTLSLIKLLKACKVRLIILDEVNHLADRGAEKSHYLVGDWIKQIIQESGVPIALVGTPAAAILWETNEQLADRYHEVIRLRALSSDPSRLRELRNVLNAFLAALDGVPCIDLTDEKHARTIAFATAGRLRDIRRLLVRAVEIAAAGERFAITRSTLAQAFLEVVYPDAPDKRNPFSGKFDWIPLTKSGEPFAPRGRTRQ